MSGTISRKRVGRVRSGARQRRSRPTPLPVAERAAVGAAKIARLVVDGEAPRTPTRAERTLFSCLTRHWPDGAFVHTLMTAGGFVQLEMQVPSTVHKGWDSRPCDIKPFVAEAAGVVKAVLSKRVLKAMRGKVRVLTVGIDVNPGEDFSAELVAIVDVSTGRVKRWTGKSYPCGWQVPFLVQVVDIGSHLIRICGERLLVLGCHDLNMFSARARATMNRNGPLRRRSDEMIRAARRFRPTIAVQHAHHTDSPRTWSTAWGGLRSQLATHLKAWATGIVYDDPDPRSSLEAVCNRTASGDQIDIVV